MQFQVGERVVHPVYGSGHIAAIPERQFSEGQMCLYYQICWPGRHIWLPVESQESSRLRLITVRSDLDQFRILLKSPPVTLQTNYRQRQRELVDLLAQGSFQGVCEVVRDLTAWGGLKPLNATDMVILQKTRVGLHHEWMLAAGVFLGEAIKEIDALLQAGRGASKLSDE